MNLGIKAHELTVVKDNTPILESLSFTIPTGSITGLLGPSGSGKTTLMRCIVGVQKITGGELTVLDMPAGTPRLRSKIGYVTQAPAIYDDLTVAQNVRYFAALTSTSATQADAIIERVGLGVERHRLAERLSGGQRARVSLAIALLGSPALLVLDEPTVGLDPLLRQSLWDLFQEIAAEGKAILVSSHVMDEAERCDQLLLLREGRVVWNGTRDGLLDETKEPTVEAAFIKRIRAIGEGA